MPSTSQSAAQAVDQDRLWRRLMEMAAIGAAANGGVNRQALSAEDARARRLLVDWAADRGFQARIDEVGNLYVGRAGTDPAAAPVLTGSHLDSQPSGGKFDGAYGVIGGFEALEAIERAGIATTRPIEVVAWTNEEGSRFQPGAMGSAVFAGELRLADLLATTDRGGTTFEQALAETLAATPEPARRQTGFAVAAYLEAHIEQGPRLEATGNTIGVVSAIQGIRWFTVEVFGEEAHAGTTPLRQRKDALKAALAMVGALESWLADTADIVRFTVGRFEVRPGAPSTVPGHALFTIDLRHPEAATIDRLGAGIEAVCRANARACRFSISQTIDAPPTDFDPAVIDLVRRQADALGLANMTMPSGAGHDAMHLAPLCPSGMIFVPCEKGISHNEAEAADPADLAAGARLLAACLVELANR